ncbi:MAG: redoxin domain-containing protein [Bryobacterales bacterium]|nr:redoxin domain-containing protein [Bryobacterales bacterium]
MRQHPSLWNARWKRRSVLDTAVRALALPATFLAGAIAGQFTSAQSTSSANQTSPSDLNRVSTGSTAPAFELPDPQQKPRSLASFRGMPVVLVFYRGSW